MDAKATVEGVEVSTLHWIGGERVASASRSAVGAGAGGAGGAALGTATFADVSPVDETVIAEVASGGPADAERAVAAARSAFPGWDATPPTERARLLQAVADGVDAQVERLAVVETRDNGSLLRSLRRSVMPRVARNFRFFADQLLALTGSSGAERQAFEQDGHRSRVAWDPAGVTAVVTPWNAPLMLATWRVAPALAAGDTVVLKPPEWAPLTASLLADVARDAGLPDGVLNVLQGTGEEAGAALVAHPGVDRVAFTGSAATGRLVAQAAGANLTPVSLELGGKSPLLVFADADLDAAVGQAANQYDNAGQVCLAGTRLLVEEPVYDEFVERLSAAAKGIHQGDPRSERSDVGPLISREHFDRVDGFVRRARAAGATVAFGGGPNQDLGGLYYQPTLFTGVPEGAEILADEVFGPVLTAQPFAGEDQAVALANATRYGLAAILYTGDRARAERVAARLVAGTVWVNCFFVRDLRAPFGGARDSGIGREGGTYSFDFYADVKTVCTAPWQ